MSRGVKLRNARRLPHVRAAMAYLALCGADAVEIDHGTAIRLRWRHDTQSMAISLTATTTGAERESSLALQAIRRRYRAIGIEVGA
ncbi:hypothetical protein [Beijerinckia sp. L45]|uniref:hypothetical protein n=1 Tax=Beijerinckia sp. L45 TaxID=1641855 RepID=UPI00131D30C1|nr:hypothetical protein [Beijerinckia sp. L45]